MTKSDELTAAREVEAVVSTLVSSMPPTEAQLSTMRRAASVATRAIRDFSSQKALDEARHEVGLALAAVSIKPDSHFIDRAKGAVRSWLSELAALGRPPRS
jgi:hypothetical protein